MKKLMLLAMVIGCLLVPATTQSIVVDDPVMVAQNRVWCCCQTSAGVCCGWVAFCPGFIPGCWCK